MPPSRWQVLVRGRPLADDVAERLSELRVTSSLDATANTCELTIAGDAPEISIPDMGTLVQPAIRDQAGGLVTLGDYALAETEIDFAPARLRIRCAAMDFTGPLKDPRTQAWDDTTLGDIVNGIAARYEGYEGVCEPGLAAQAIAHVDQTDESDLHFLTRLSRTYDATVQVVLSGEAGGNSIVLAPVGATASARSGAALPTRVITPSDRILRASISRTARPRYGTVRAYYQDIDAGATISVDVGDGEPRYRLRQIRATHEEAKAAAQAAHDRLKRETASLRLEIPGDPALMAGTRLRTEGWGPQKDTVFQITRAVHIIGQSGYRVGIDGDSIPLE